MTVSPYAENVLSNQVYRSTDGIYNCKIGIFFGHRNGFPDAGFAGNTT